jgi:hypothetical protein
MLLVQCEEVLEPHLYWDPRPAGQLSQNEAGLCVGSVPLVVIGLDDGTLTEEIVVNAAPPLLLFRLLQISSRQAS